MRHLWEGAKGMCQSALRSLHQPLQPATEVSIPSWQKSSTIIPKPKTPATYCLNDYHPITKCFERLVLHHLKTRLPSTFDAHHFAYRANRLTEDAIAIALHSALDHVENQDNYIWGCFLLIAAQPSILSYCISSYIPSPTCKLPDWPLPDCLGPTSGVCAVPIFLLYHV